jgi:putative membrane protein
MHEIVYGIVKSLHIVFVISWFAALFYLPRLFVYHAMAEDRIGIERFKVMERKLFGMMTFAGVLAIAFGLYLWLGIGIHGTWLYIKLVLVAVLVAYHIYCGKLMIDFRNDRNRHSHVFYRWLNEFPLLLIVAIVLLVVFKRPA